MNLVPLYLIKWAKQMLSKFSTRNPYKLVPLVYTNM